MARNKYPEETRNHIVDVAAKLFLEKGYENTSIQDIIDNLGGLSKGAIYHHFKSKDDIMNEVGDRFCEDAMRKVQELAKRSDLNGKEKIRQTIRASFYNPSQELILTAAPDMLNNPRLLAIYIKESILVVGPGMLQPLIEEGIADGSIQTDYPRELAEIITLLGNIWLNPMIYQCDTEQAIQKMKFFQKLLREMGLDVIEDDIFLRFSKYMDVYKEHKER